MSYDIYLNSKPCPMCANVKKAGEGLHPTYNLTPIFDFAITGEPLPNRDTTEGQVVVLHAKTDRPRGLRILHEQTAADTIRPLENALARMKDPALHEEFRKLEPSNGWGSADGARKVLATMLGLARQHPEFVWSIW